MKKKIDILIVDDNLHDIQGIILTLKTGFINWTKQINFLSYSNPLQAIEDIKNKEIVPDIILVDIDMPHMTGFRFVELCGYNRLLAPQPYIIIVSAHTDFYQMASDKRLEYLTKGKEVNEKLVLKIQEYLNTWTINLRENEAFTLYKLFDICYLEAEGSYTNIYFKDKTVSLISKSIGEIETEEMLSSKGFIRCHEKYLANRFSIQNYIAGDRGKFSFGELLSEDKNIIRISKKFRKKFDVQNIINEYKGKV